VCILQHLQWLVAFRGEVIDGIHGEMSNMMAVDVGLKVAD